MNKNIKYIAILVAIILLVIGIILINNNRPINIYRKQVKTIVKEYLNKNIDNEYAYKKLNTLYDELDKEYKNNKNTDYLSLKTKVLGLTLDLLKDDYLKVKEELKDL